MFHLTPTNQQLCKCITVALLHFDISKKDVKTTHRCTWCHSLSANFSLTQLFPEKEGRNPRTERERGKETSAKKNKVKCSRGEEVEKESSRTSKLHFTFNRDVKEKAWRAEGKRVNYTPLQGLPLPWWLSAGKCSFYVLC